MSRLHRYLASTYTGPLSREGLSEAKASQLALMFPPVLQQTPQQKAVIANEIKWARQVLKRQDRVMWYLKRVRVKLAFSYAQEATPDQKPLYDQFLQKYIKADGVAFQDATVQGVGTPTWKNGIDHLMSMALPEIDAVQWNDGVPSATIMTKMNQAEHKWRETRGKHIDMSLDAEATKVMDFPDGFAWWNLNRPTCSAEAAAMGHCGNTQFAIGTILSLRQQDKRNPNLWYPVATFILHDDGYLGEMKGRNNDKPISSYHKYIVELLRHDMIEGIRGGGYQPEHNFSIHDLEDEDEKEKLLQQKPNLKGQPGFVEQYKKLKDFSKIDFSELPDELQPYDDHLHENLVLCSLVGDRDDLIREIIDHEVMPQVGQLAKLRDNLDGLEFDPKKPLHTQMTDVAIQEFWDALSTTGKNFIKQELRIGPMANRNEFLSVIHGIQHGTSRTINDLLDRAGRFTYDQIPSDLTVEKIDARIDKYLEFDYVLTTRTYNASITQIEGKRRKGEYYVTMDVDYYLSAMDSYMAYKRDYNEDLDDDYWVLDVADNGWLGDDSGDSSHTVERLKEAGLIVDGPKPSDGRYWSEYNIASYVDSKYGKYGNGDDITAANEDTVYAEHLAEEFEKLLTGARSRSGPQQDDDTMNMFPESMDFSLARLRARAGIR